MAMAKDDWIEAARVLLAPHLGDHALEYATGLYTTFVEEDDPECTPQEAVDEDMTYWE